MAQLTLNSIMNNVEKHWQADSYFTGQEVGQSILDRIRGLNKISRFLEQNKIQYLLSSVGLAGACAVTTFSAISSSVLLTTIALVTSVVLALLTWDYSNTHSAMNTLYNIVVEFSDTLQSSGNQETWNTSHGQRCRWSRDLYNAKWYSSNMFFLPNPMNKKYENPNLQNLVPIIVS